MSLIPLRIPMGFAVCFNKFSDVDPYLVRLGMALLRTGSISPKIFCKYQ